MKIPETKKSMKSVHTRENPLIKYPTKENGTAMNTTHWRDFFTGMIECCRHL